MKPDFEYMSYSDSERLAMLENRAAELERQLGRVTPDSAGSGDRTGAYPTINYGATEYGACADGESAEGSDYAYRAGRHARTVPGHGEPPTGYANGPARYSDAAGAHSGASGPYPDATTVFLEAGTGQRAQAMFGGARVPGYAATGAGAYAGAPGTEEPDERTEVLINQGRHNARPPGAARWLKHWRAIAVGAAAVAIGVMLLAVILPGPGATWPASVAQVENEIAVACQNPNVVSEPSQVNFACAKDTRQILWVFSLLTSGDNPNYTDTANGRKGLEPITPTQGGDVAWSLNLHHPYNPASPTDSLEVAARAINDIIGGATLTGSNGAPVVQPGLESNAANCARYTGSSALVTRQGFPAICALPLTSPAGQAALVSDVFQQWMVGTPSQVATEAGVLFANADNPGDPRVQAILNTLPDSGL